MRVLALGDIVGRPGRQAVHELLPSLVRREKIDLVVANAENVAGGSGITANLFNKLRHYGVDVCTLGDHAYKKLDIASTLNASERLLRPANLSRLAAGRGQTFVDVAGTQVCVATLLGRVFMSHLPADDPFAAAERVMADAKARGCKVIVVEIHAEATSEKLAVGHYLDGRASFVFGTHTHVPTADARVLPGGTAHVTDLGMTGPYDSVLGRRKDMVVKAMTTNMPFPFDVATGDVKLCGALADIDEATGRARSCVRVELQASGVGNQAYDADDKG